MGLDAALVDLKLQDFLCAICLEFPLSPWECKKCRQLFCETCLKTWRDSHSECCPLRCTRPKYAQIRDTFERILTNVQVRCKHQVNGCSETRSIKEIRTHENQCPYTRPRSEEMELDDSPTLQVPQGFSVEETRFREAYQHRQKRPLTIDIPGDDGPTVVFQPLQSCAMATPRVMWTASLDWGQSMVFPQALPMYIPVRYAGFGRPQF